MDLPLVVVLVLAPLPSHGARSLRSTEAEAVAVGVAVFSVALPLAVTTWASADFAVTTLEVLDVLTLKLVFLTRLVVFYGRLDDLCASLYAIVVCDDAYVF